MIVLITSVGSNTAISVIKTLRKSWNNITIIGTDSNALHLCAGHKLVDQFYTLPGVRARDEYVTRMKEILDEHHVQCLIPIHDLEIELIAEYRSELSAYAFPAVNDLRVVETCNDKGKANEMARLAGLMCPAEPEDNGTGMRYPLIAKPLKGVSSAGMTMITDQPSLDDYLRRNGTGDQVLQEFIQGTEYTVDTFSTYDGVFYGGVARRRIETKAGISTKGVTARRDELLMLSKKLLDQLQYKGAANIQFIERDGVYYFIEINPRFSGGGILSYEAGFNSPKYTLMQASGMSLPAFDIDSMRYNLYMSRYWEESFCQLPE